MRLRSLLGAAGALLLVIAVGMAISSSNNPPTYGQFPQLRERDAAQLGVSNTTPNPNPSRAWLYQGDVLVNQPQPAMLGFGVGVIGPQLLPSPASPVEVAYQQIQLERLQAGLPELDANTAAIVYTGCVRTHCALNPERFGTALNGLEQQTGYTPNETCNLMWDYNEAVTPVRWAAFQTKHPGVTHANVSALVDALNTALAADKLPDPCFQRVVRSAQAWESPPLTIN